MKAMRAHQFGGPEQLKFEDAPEPQLQAGQVMIRVRAAGINPADLVRLSGRLGSPPLPYIPGSDVCGEIEKIDAGSSKAGNCGGITGWIGDDGRGRTADKSPDVRRDGSDAV